MVNLFSKVDSVINWATPLFAAIGVCMMVFFGLYIYIWGASTGIVLFTGASVLLLVLQFMGTVKLWEHPWLVVIPPALIIVGYATQSLSLFSVVPWLSASAPAAMLTMVDWTVVTLYTVGISIVVALVVSFLVKKK